MQAIAQAEEAESSAAVLKRSWFWANRSKLKLAQARRGRNPKLADTCILQEPEPEVRAREGCPSENSRQSAATAISCSGRSLSVAAGVDELQPALAKAVKYGACDSCIAEGRRILAE